MSKEHRPGQPMFSQIDVSHASAGAPRPGHHVRGTSESSENTQLLREILSAQDRQNELLEELVTQIGAAHRQRAAELGDWKQANPALARNCRHAAESLSKVQTEFLTSLTDEIRDNFDALYDGEFMLNEFVDRFGPRLAHLNGVLQVLTQLSSVTSPTNTPNTP
ncbi:MAG: hypothetical protein U9N87_01115 [Planctomycetota bacterium]|nr:hypothetical protein [Planctomycetota bacterium]